MLSFKRSHKYSAYLYRVVVFMAGFFILIPIPFFIRNLPGLWIAVFEFMVLSIGYARTFRYTRFFIAELTIDSGILTMVYYKFNSRKEINCPVNLINAKIIEGITGKSRKAALIIKVSNDKIIQAEKFGWSNPDFKNILSELSR